MHRPPLVCDSSSHSRRPQPLVRRRETLMVGTEVIDRPDQIHSVLHGRQLARQAARASRQAGQACAERAIEPLDVRVLVTRQPGVVRSNAAIRAPVPVTNRRTMPQAPRRSLMTWTMLRCGHGTRRGAPRWPVRCGVRKTCRKAVG